MANLSNINNKFLFTDGDFLKIGNLAPINNISSTESGISVTNSNVASITLDNTAASGKRHVMYSSGNGSLVFWDSDAASARLQIDSSGNATFAGSLIANNYISIKTASSSGSPYIDFLQNTTQKAYIQFNDGANALNFQSDNAFTFIGGSVERVRIDGVGNVGIGTISPGEKLEVDGNAELKGNLIINKFSNTAPYADGEIRFTGRYDRYVGGIKTFSDNASYPEYANGLDFFVQRHVYALPNGHLAMRIDSEGNVGIGTTSPQQKLHINGNVRVGTDTGFIDFARPGGAIVGGIGWHTDGYFYVAGHPTAGTGAGNNVRVYAFGSLLSLGNPTVGDALTVAVNGNIGIGDTGPDQKLNVRDDGGSDTFRGIEVHNNSISQARAGICFKAYDWVQSAIWHGRGSTAAYNGALVLGTNPDTSDLTVAGVTGRMWILNSGNVGIGTSSPSKKLEVAGSYKLGTNAYIQYDAGYPYTINMLNTAAVGNLILNAGAGSSGFESKIELQGSNTAGAAGITLSTGSSPRMVVTADGRVGIGNTNPQAALDISSSYSIQGGVYTYYYTGTAQGQSNINLDITVNNEGGGGNVFKIEAGFAHYYGMSYNSIGEWWCTSRGTNVVNTYILNAGSTNAGTWSSSKPTTSVLRITKSAGTYVGGGKYWVKVTYRPY